MTNFERIKNMEVAELATFLMSIYTPADDDWSDSCCTYINGVGFDFDDECIEWLESESETEENVG